MTISADSQKKIDDFLNVLHTNVRGLGEQEASDIVAEIRSHILDKASPAGTVTPEVVSSILAGLGGPQELAKRYLTDEVLARALARRYVTDGLLTRARVTRSPWLTLRSLFHWASLSFAGIWVLLASLVGYGLGAAFLLCAMLKPMHPQKAGLWLLPNPSDTSLSLRLGFGTVPVNGRELLGWWVVPLGLVMGSALIVVTFRLGLWSIGKFWRLRPLAGPLARGERV